MNCDKSIYVIIKLFEIKQHETLAHDDDNRKTQAQVKDHPYQSTHETFSELS